MMRLRLRRGRMIIVQDCCDLMRVGFYSATSAS